MSDGKIKMRSLSGPEKLRLFEGISIKKLANLIPSLPKVKDVDSLWLEFYQIYASLTNHTFDDIKSLKISTSSWQEVFVSVYQGITVTPYIHLFANHLYEMVEVHGNISLLVLANNIFAKIKKVHENVFLGKYFHENFFLSRVYAPKQFFSRKFSFFYFAETVFVKPFFFRETFRGQH